jgi:thiamine-monophosphate kinase
LKDHEKIAKLENIKIIGHITSPSLGMRLVTRDGNEIDFKAQGWNAFEE